MTNDPTGEPPGDVTEEMEPWHDKEKLAELYWDEGMTLEEIADHFEVSYGTIREKFEKYDIERRDKGEGGTWYSDDEMLAWIDVYVEEFGVVPTSEDMRSWPGPSGPTYSRRFGSVPEAIREAGYEPRQKQQRQEDDDN